MTLNRIDHFVITTKNLCQCLHFYVDILGMEHKIQREENDQHTLHFGNQKINIHTYDDINQVKKEMDRNGVEVIAGIIKTEGAQGEMKSIYVYDPDGNLVEIASYL